MHLVRWNPVSLTSRHILGDCYWLLANHLSKIDHRDWARLGELRFDAFYMPVWKDFTVTLIKKVLMVDFLKIFGDMDGLLLGAIFPWGHWSFVVLHSFQVELSLCFTHLSLFECFETLVVCRGQLNEILRVRHVFFVAIIDRIYFVAKLCCRQSLLFF